ncbi:pantothenate kinase [Cardiosporidium cionae]|uniref:Pantothenate kinase n=1 Tax=Cardiosporidium cionae TaxID=476202 RepID=A0ABQ7JF53_9APIC|nr:pantothenate kinase [Cardiosporidium cionae]|eukprot:KAF8822509.1 pantothenate kinase [Cardiosporidium cionae]
MGNHIGIEVGSYGVQVGCLLCGNSSRNTELSSNNLEDFLTISDRVMRDDPFFAHVEETPVVSFSPQSHSCTPTEESESRTGFPQLLRPCNLKLKWKNISTENERSHGIGLTGMFPGNKDEENLISFLDALKSYFEILCEVLTTSSSQLPFSRVYMWNLPKEAIDTAISLCIPYIMHKTVVLTGIGSKELTEKLKWGWGDITAVKLEKEVPCILKAIDYVLYNGPECVFSYERTHRALNEVLPDPNDYYEQQITEADKLSFYPFLLVNLKAGVSFFKVTSPTQSSRIGGSTIGGATFMGLCRLLSDDANTPEEAMLSAHNGNNTKCDMLVSDIYGGGYNTVGLPGHVIASTFGKLQTLAFVDSTSDDEMDEMPPESLVSDIGMKIPRPSDSDIIRSLLTMMSYNVMQQAFFHSRIHNLPRIVLVGFLLDIPAFLASIQHSINFWSQGDCKIHFFRLSPFLATLGAALYSVEATADNEKEFSDEAQEHDVKTKLESFLLDARGCAEIHGECAGYVNYNGKAVTLLHSPNISFILPAYTENNSCTIESPTSSFMQS